MSADESAAELLDLERYPITDLEGSAARAVIEAQRRSLADKGVAILPGFVGAAATARMAREVAELAPRAFLEDAWGTPYLLPADDAFPEDHPRRSLQHSLTWVLAYDLIPRRHALRSLYEWDPLMHFVGAILQRHPLYRMADPLGALNATIMDEGHVQGWHYDNTEFVVSLALQSSREGGHFECAPLIRAGGDERYERVAHVLSGDGVERVEIFPMTPGTLMIFAGRNSIHRVSAVRGAVPRMVALLSYDTRPDADSSEVFKYVRYGRSTPVSADV
jgi:hypothetical protein